MMEVLATLFIVSVALVGLTSLQTESLRVNGNALYESQAQFLIEDMIDRMRSYGIPSEYGADWNDADPEQDCVNNRCDNPENIPLSDLREWRGLVRAYLPDGASRIRRAPDAGMIEEYEITVRFNAVRGAEAELDGNTRAVTVRARF